MLRHCEGGEGVSWDEKNSQCSACIFETPHVVHGCLEARYKYFSEKGDSEGFYNTWSMLVDARVRDWPAVGGLSQLLDELQSYKRRFPLFPSLPTAANVKIGELAATMIVDPASSSLVEIADTCDYFAMQIIEKELNTT